MVEAPVIRLTGPDAPAPASFPLEQAFVPQVEAIVGAVGRITERNQSVATKLGGAVGVVA